MWDTPDHEPTQKLAAAIYENGGVIGAVCHGLLFFNEKVLVD
jgi:putative intracellular protease/amidase